MLATSKEPLQIKLEKENVLLLSDGIIIGTFNQSSFKLTNFSLAFTAPSNALLLTLLNDRGYHVHLSSARQSKKKT